MDYEADFHRWLERQIAVLEARDFGCVDVEHLVEELEAMAGNLRRELNSRLHVLLVHLLKCQYTQVAQHERGWKLTIREQRRQIRAILKQSPSLQFHLPELFMDAWEWACEDMRVLGVGAPLPKICPWDFETIISEGFIPNEHD
jgi:hypothetical protein